MKFRFSLLFFLLTEIVYGQPSIVKIPMGKTVLVDGKISPGEWVDAKRIKISDTLDLFVKNISEYILIAIKIANDKNVIADLYCTNRNTILNLHTSAKLGQRKLIKGKWPVWIWWNNENWSANVSRVESFDKLNFLNENVREFQIHKSLFKTNSTFLFFEITFVDANISTNTVSFPVGCQSISSKNWLKIKW